LTHLLDLLELVDTEDSPDILSSGTSLLPEARRITTISVPREVFGSTMADIISTRQDKGHGSYLSGRSFEGASNHSFIWKAEMGCSEVAIKYLSTSSPEI
jgi:hypothetical protein